jgi:hypothetical protein
MGLGATASLATRRLLVLVGSGETWNDHDDDEPPRRHTDTGDEPHRTSTRCTPGCTLTADRTGTPPTRWLDWRRLVRERRSAQGLKQSPVSAPLAVKGGVRHVKFELKIEGASIYLLYRFGCDWSSLSSSRLRESRALLARFRLRACVVVVSPRGVPALDRAGRFALLGSSFCSALAGPAAGDASASRARRGSAESRWGRNRVHQAQEARPRGESSQPLETDIDRVCTSSRERNEAAMVNF